MRPQRPTVLLHFAARTRAGFPIFRNPDLARKTWLTLRALQPTATLAAILMPDHLHWLVRISPSEVDDLKRSLEIRLGMLAQSAGQRPGLWDPVAAPKDVADRKHLLRTVRYILLNPNRRGLIEDPLTWRWSTLLDTIGAVPDPWISANHLARELQWDSTGFVQSFVDYVYRDETVPVPPPRLPAGPDLRAAVPLHTLPQIRDAFARAHRVPAESLQPKSFLRTRLLYTATSMKWDVTRHITAFTGMNRRNAVRMRRKWRLAAGEPRHRAELRATHLLALRPDWGTRS